jgi:nitrogen fixation-related uncharacterized protein
VGLFIWGLVSGQFRNVEEPKYRIFEAEDAQDEERGGEQWLNLPGFFWTSFWIFLVSIVLITLFIWLFARGKKSYSVDNTESHAESYANVIKEGHGGMNRISLGQFCFDLLLDCILHSRQLVAV